MVISKKKNRSSLCLPLFINCFSQTMFLALARRGQKKPIHGPRLEMYGNPCTRKTKVLKFCERTKLTNKHYTVYKHFSTNLF